MVYYDDNASFRHLHFTLHSAILGLPKTIQRAAENVEKETGWVMTVMLGGIDPDSGGIMSYM